MWKSEQSLKQADGMMASCHTILFCNEGKLLAACPVFEQLLRGHSMLVH